MKGYFSLNYNYGTEELQFGNLNVDLGTLGSITDAVRDSSIIPTLIAHDVVEHTVSHRTKTYVTYEEEIRAVGAIGFVRCSDCFDMYQEVHTQLEISHRDIKPVPYIMGKFLLEGHWVSSDMMRYLIQNGISPSNARNAVYQYAWGDFQKQTQFEFSDYRARSAFDFVERNVPTVLDAIYEEQEMCTGASVYFDTTKQIFRYQFKRYH
jgi:hypothetical protein